MVTGDDDNGGVRRHGPENLGGHRCRQPLCSVWGNFHFFPSLSLFNIHSQWESLYMPCATMIIQFSNHSITNNHKKWWFLRFLSLLSLCLLLSQTSLCSTVILRYFVLVFYIGYFLYGIYDILHLVYDNFFSKEIKKSKRWSKGCRSDWEAV